MNNKLSDFREKRRERRRARYELARSLGFTAEEACLMAGWSEERIRAAVVGREAATQKNVG